MRARHVLSIAFGLFMTSSFLKPCETYGFMMGGSGQGKDCEIFIPATQSLLPSGVELPDNYDVALTNESGEIEWVRLW